MLQQMVPASVMTGQHHSLSKLMKDDNARPVSGEVSMSFLLSTCVHCMHAVTYAKEH